MLEQSTKDGLSDFSPESVLLGKERFAVFETALKAMPRMRRRIFLLVRGAIATLDICACNTELPTQHILFKLATADFTRCPILFGAAKRAHHPASGVVARRLGTHWRRKRRKVEIGRA